MLPPNQNNNMPPSGQDDKKKRQGTGFANINRILQANQGAGQRIGQAVGGNISKQAEDVRKGIESGRQQFQAGKQAATQQAGQKIGAANQLVRQQNETDEAYAQRVAQAQNAGQVGQDLRATQYSGPMQLQDQERLQSQAMNVSALSKLAGQGAAGQDVLMRNMVAGRGGYTRGQSALDRLLVGKEGQREMQAGRQAGIGLTAKTGTAIQSAQQQAQAAKQNIEAEREKAQQGIMSGATSLQELGQKRAQQFSKDVADLQKVLAGEDIGDTARANDLISRMQEFGLDPNQMVYGGNVTVNNENMIKSILGDLASRGQAVGLGNYKFDDTTRSAGINLAQALADQGREKLFKEEQFDADAFKNETEATRQADELYARDLQTQNILKELSGDIGSLENRLQQESDAAYSQAVERINKSTASDQAKKDALARLNREKQIADYRIVNRDAPLTDLERQRMSEMNSMDQFNASETGQLFNQIMANTRLRTGADVRAETDPMIRDKYGQYGWIQYGDRGTSTDPTGIDQRFAGLGLERQPGLASGQFRTRAQIDEAARKSLGSFQSLRDLLMGRLNPQKDPNVQEDRVLTQR